MKRFVVVFAVTIIVVSSKPIDKTNSNSDLNTTNKSSGSNYQLVHEPRRTKRQISDEVILNKQFFNNIFYGSRISRDTNDVIDLNDLISSVEHTLIHSAQNLAASNITLNSSVSEVNNPVTIQHASVALPFTIPVPKSDEVDEIDEVVTEITTNTEMYLMRDSRSDNKNISEQEKTDFESVKPIRNSNLELLFPVSLNPIVNVSHANLKSEEEYIPRDEEKTTPKDEEEHTVASVTEEAKPEADPSNITIIQTINSTQLIPTPSSDVVHVHQQQITIFSANAGIFPNIHAVNVESVLAQKNDSNSGATEKKIVDCSQDKASYELPLVEQKNCIDKSSVVTPKTIDSVEAPLVETVKDLKTEELKEKIAEVEADPVILTQGI